MKKYKDSDKAHIRTIEDYNTLYKKSINEPDKFWADIAKRISWYKKWDYNKCKKLNFEENIIIRSEYISLELYKKIIPQLISYLKT
ncbi:MAG: hypothetical protein CBD26_02840 [Candidatus Pelagibacter sp. TMED166]|nr:MAG: hypothetical protein CBD26_02840 [Candidatus Pelagibacter sp. TMED166]